MYLVYLANQGNPCVGRILWLYNSKHEYITHVNNRLKRHYITTTSTNTTVVNLTPLNFLNFPKLYYYCEVILYI